MKMLYRSSVQGWLPVYYIFFFSWRSYDSYFKYIFHPFDKNILDFHGFTMLGKKKTHILKSISDKIIVFCT